MSVQRLGQAYAEILEGMRERRYFFFFQAEDGIRDLTVTGVQTCALPISARTRLTGKQKVERRNERAIGLAMLPAKRSLNTSEGDTFNYPADHEPDLGSEIGRASCRERV